MPWECRPETLDFIKRAPAVFVNEADLPASPERVFEVFADITTWPKWFDDMKRTRWLPGSKGGLGDQRVMELGLLTVTETFLAWEPGGRTHLDWRVHYELKLWARLIHPILRIVFGRQFKRTVAGLQRFLT